MDFKGTKVFPKYHGGDNYSIDLIFNNGATISIDRRSRYSEEVVCSRLEMEYNALLISKAPEMLDILSEMYNEWCETGMSESKLSDYMLEVKNLIKQATEL